MKKYIVFTLAAFMAFVQFSCSPNTEQATYKLENITFDFEGPLFEGPNMGQYTVKVNLPEQLDGVEASQVHQASLKSAAISAGEGTDFGLISSLVLQLASEDAEMVQAGVLNPIPEGSTEASLQPSTEAELTDFFKGESFILVLDAGLNEDLFENMQLKGTFEFNLEIKK